MFITVGSGGRVWAELSGPETESVITLCVCVGGQTWFLLPHFMFFSIFSCLLADAAETDTSLLLLFLFPSFLFAFPL